MARLALADALPDFGVSMPRIRPAESKAADKDPEEKLREAVAEAVAKAEAALAERLALEHEAKLAAERAQHAEEMQEALARFGDEAGAAVKACFEALEQKVVSVTSGLAARILGAALSEDLQKQAVAEFERILRAVLKEDGAVRVHVRGNALLWSALKAQLGDLAARVDFTEAPGFDIAAEIDESLFETRLAEWSVVLSEVLQ